MATFSTENFYGINDPDKRRADPGERKTYEVKNLWSRHHEIIRLALLGWKNTKIASQLGITPESVSQVLNCQLGKEKLKAMQLERDASVMDVKREVDSLLPAAMKVYEEILNADETNTRVSMSLKKATADTITQNLGGHEAPKQLNIAHGHFDVAQIEKLKQRGLELARANGMLAEENPTSNSDEVSDLDNNVVDAEVVEVEES